MTFGGPEVPPARCARCDAVRPSGSPAGLCPRCLLAMGIEPAAGATDRDGPLTLLEEIGRGGMAVVHKGVDADLQRVLAVKLIQERHVARREMVDLFLREARIAGGLQHPGVVPVYGLGALPDGRLYFTMKLVEGQTMAAVLAERPGPGPAVGRLLPTLLQIAQTLAYTHARGVVHGDVTPSNVMLGRFGEVQLMDWGLARVVADDDAPGVGAVGTPGYLAPERAAGTVGRPDTRSDVFALGSILCEILTGSPAYRTGAADRVEGRPPPPDLSDGLSRLASCGADRELTALAEDCLSSDPELRPADGGAFASRLSAYLDGVAERLRVAELARVAAETSAREEARRRRLRAGLAVLGVALLGLVGFVVEERSRRLESRRAAGASALRETEMLRHAAAADPSGDPARWRTALQALERASPLLSDAPAEIRLRLASSAGEVRRRLDAAVLDRRLLDALETVRHLAEDGEHELAGARFEAVFRDRGIDVLTESPAAVGRAVRDRPRDVAAALIAALDDWAIVRLQAARVGLGSAGSADAPLAAARAADPDPLRGSLRDAFRAGDRTALVRLARSADVASLPLPSLWLMGRMLSTSGEVEEADSLLLAAWNAHPNDFWINYELGLVLTLDPPRLEEALGYASGAVALRPGSAAAHLRLAYVRACFTDKVDCEPEFREAVRLAPEYFQARLKFGTKLMAWGRFAEAAEEFREAIRHFPRDRPYHPGIERTGSDAGVAEDHSWFPWVARIECLRLLSRLDEAETELAEAVRRFPGSLQVWVQAARLGMARLDPARTSEALDRAEALNKPGAHLPASTAAALARERARLAMLRRFPAVRGGKDRPKDDAERLDLAWVCGQAGRGAFAAPLYAEVFEAEPKSAEGRPSEPRRLGALAAATAGLGRSRDEPAPDAAGRTRLRAQALGWLRAELAAFTPAVKRGGHTVERRDALLALRGWLHAHELGGVRDPDLVTLPADEQTAWRSFWADVRALLPRDTD